MPTWDPAVYERYKTYRDRPAIDLLTQIPRDLAPREIWDLGCGTGEQAAVLAARHPQAAVHGLDSSAEMLAKARARPAPVEWIQGDIAAFDPSAPPDLIFTNAALQWLPDHPRLFPRLVATLAPGGVFACQMPTPSEARHHAMLNAVVAEGPWAKIMAGARAISPTAASETYYDWLAPLCGEIDIWTTTYLHALEGDDPVVDWMSGAGLRPYLDVVAHDPQMKAEFLAVLKARAAATFPKRPDGVTLLPYRRIFIVARRAS